MKKRVIWKMFVLEIVTLGIYRLYWLVKTRNEMVARDENVKIKSPWFLLAPIAVVIVSLLIMLVGFFTALGSRTTCISSANENVTSSSSTKSKNTKVTKCVENSNNIANVSILASLVFYIGLFVAFIMYVVWLWGYCRGVEIITKEKTSFAIALVILILVPDGIDILIIQDGFNKISDSDSATPIAPAQPAVA